MSYVHLYKPFSPFTREVDREIAYRLQTKSFRWEPLEAWQLKRLEAVYHASWNTCSYAAKHCGISRQTVANYRDLVIEKGLDALFEPKKIAGAPCILTKEQKSDFVKALKDSKIRNTKEAKLWIEHVTGKKMSASGVRKLLHRIILKYNEEQQSPAVRRWDRSSIVLKKRHKCHLSLEAHS